MRDLGGLWLRRDEQKLASCNATRHAWHVATERTRIRQELGAELARIRGELGMKRQSDLAKRAHLGQRTVVAVERGEKVANSTMRKIEKALGLPTFSTDDYIDGKINTLTREPSPDYERIAEEDPIVRALRHIRKEVGDEEFYSALGRLLRERQEREVFPGSKAHRLEG